MRDLDWGLYCRTYSVRVLGGGIRDLFCYRGSKV